jgi:hypothetical protein
MPTEEVSKSRKEVMEHPVSPVSAPRGREPLTREHILDAADMCIATCVKLGRPFVKKSDLMEPSTSGIIFQVVEVG